MADAVELPQHYFRARCQAPECRTLLGGFHIPCDGGLIVYSCGKCGKTSVFRNEKFGIRAVAAPPLHERPEGQQPTATPAAPGAPRSRR